MWAHGRQTDSFNVPLHEFCLREEVMKTNESVVHINFLPFLRSKKICLSITMIYLNTSYPFLFPSAIVSRVRDALYPKAGLHIVHVIFWATYQDIFIECHMREWQLRSQAWTRVPCTRVHLDSSWVWFTRARIRILNEYSLNSLSLWENKCQPMCALKTVNALANNVNEKTWMSLCSNWSQRCRMRKWEAKQQQKTHEYKLCQGESTVKKTTFGSSPH